MEKKVRTRIAPSPTGMATVGNMRTALFNYLFAKKHGGEFLLRIEDTDSKRFVEGAEKYVIDSLKWLGISPDSRIDENGKAIYRQSEKEYKSFSDILINKGMAYYAFDSDEELANMKKTLGINTSYNKITRMNMKNSFTLSDDEVKIRLERGDKYVVRFNVPHNISVSFTDLIRGKITFNSNEMDDKVLVKSDGGVSFHLANVVDDYRMEITHVIRGEEWLSSTPLHVLLYEAFEWDKPEFAHVPLILGPDGKKMSKRKVNAYGFPVFPMTGDYIDEKGESVHVTGFKDENYEPDALINFLALLGWNPGGTEEIMSMDRMIELFELDRINNSGAMFDIEKLRNFNAHYLRNKSIDELYLFILLGITKSSSGVFVDKKYTESEIDNIIDIAKERSIFNKDLYGNVSYFFEPVILKDDVVLKNPTEFKDVMEGFLDMCGDTYNFNSTQIKYDLEEFCNVLGFKIGKVLPDLRMALTGGIPGPHLPETMEILGKDESFERINSLLKRIEKVAS